MEVVTAPDRRAGSLYFLAERLETHANFAEVIASLAAGHGATLGGVWGSSCALAAAALVRHAPETLVVVCPRQSDIDDFCDDLALFSAVRPERFPARDAAPADGDLYDEVDGDRLRVLKQLQVRSAAILPPGA
ncbi:MAG TPA: transcription-repair coupling factor, partial [Pirellulales bacterium]|nr:transcription-repair coupling factor [Pirellulales bacterium]